MTSTVLDRNPAALDRHFDVVVIGGGITGVHVAREAAGRGLSVALFEKGDFGSGTSSATTKYLHGGIRYLEQYQFGVVRESLRERRILALGAPHLVEQRPFLMPAWKWSKPSTALIGAGVATYTAMAFDRNRAAPPSLRIPMPRWRSRSRVLNDVPWLDPVELQGGYVYHDTLNVHPERLLLAYVRDAVTLGAVMRNYTPVEGFVVDDADVVAVDVRDDATGERHTVRTRTVVNAAGPWVDIVLRPLESDERRRMQRPLGVRVQRSKGVHLLTRSLGPGPTVFCRARSGSHVIVSPWQGHSFIGPTDTPIEVEPGAVQATRDDVDSILHTVNSTLGPGTNPLTIDDVDGVTVGIRPLVDSGTDSYTASRRHELYDHGPAGAAGLWSIGGGKWTTGRATAVETLRTLLAAPQLDGVAHEPFDSRRRATFGAFGWGADAHPFFDAALHARGEVEVDPIARAHLARMYGTEFQRVLDVVANDPSLGARISTRPEIADIGAQVVIAVRDEGA
ncbi:MAG: glycerol-3-phosphate dehydrogenase/oxidase, partial [Actinomycetota bacterium]